MSGLSPAVLESQLATLLEKAPQEHGRPIAIRHLGAWDGPEQLVIGGAVYPVVQADSVLAVRAALQDAPGQPMLVLTSLERHALGRDVLARLFRRRLHAVDPWSLLLARFNATTLDPRLRARAVAEALIEVCPPGGFDAATGGVLDEDTAWSALACFGFGLDSSAHGGGDAALVAWALHPSTPDRMAAMRPAVRDAFCVWLSHRDGAAPSLATLVAKLVQYPEPGAWLLFVEALAVAPPSVHPAVQALLRQHAEGVGASDETVLRLSEAVSAVAAVDGPLVERCGDAMDRTFTAQAPVLAHSRYGLVGRLACLQALADALESADSAWPTASAVSAHRRTTAGERAAARALARLHGWMQREKPPGSTLSERAAAYLDAGSWVDLARSVALAADLPGVVQGRVNAFLGRVRARREAENLAFAQALADWTADERSLPDLCPVEDLIERVVAPLARDTPVLVLLLDGLPLSIAHQLLDQISGRDFQVVQAPGSLRAAVSTVPSRTEWARTSLFAGERRQGDLGVEKRVFARHPALTASCRATRPPALFHYGDLKRDRPGVESAVADPKARVVGVVLNAVDDELSGSAQFNRVWTLDSIRGLSAILQAARDAGRVVVLTSDHGHVGHTPEMRSEPVEKGQGGQRWSRLREVTKGEVAFHGGRVAAFVDGGAVVVPGIEGLRYVQGKAAAGYHGGATPQEILAPLFVLWPSRNAERMPPSLDRTPPTFWHPPGKDRRATPAPPPAAPAPKQAPEIASLPLFAAVAAEAVSTSWSAALRGSPLFQQRSRRLRVPAKQLDTFIDTLAGAGGQLGLGPLSRALGMGPVRVRGLAHTLQPTLNVDGFEVLAVDEEVRLDLEALRAQFELSE